MKIFCFAPLPSVQVPLLYGTYSILGHAVTTSKRVWISAATSLPDVYGNIQSVLTVKHVLCYCTQMVDQLDRYNDQLAQLNSGLEDASAANLREMSTAIQGMQRAMSQRFSNIEVRTGR